MNRWRAFQSYKPILWVGLYPVEEHHFCSRHQDSIPIYNGGTNILKRKRIYRWWCFPHRHAFFREQEWDFPQWWGYICWIQMQISHEYYIDYFFFLTDIDDAVGGHKRSYRLIGLATKRPKFVSVSDVHVVYVATLPFYRIRHIENWKWRQF